MEYNNLGENENLSAHRADQSDAEKKEANKEGSFYGYKEKHDNFYPGLDD